LKVAIAVSEVQMTHTRSVQREAIFTLANKKLPTEIIFEGSKQRKVAET